MKNKINEIVGKFVAVKWLKFYAISSFTPYQAFTPYLSCKPKLYTEIQLVSYKYLKFYNKVIPT